MVVDIVFGMNGVAGTRIPADHGYRLYGAVTEVVPNLHRPGMAYAVHPIRGVPVPGRELELGPQSVLTIRLDHDLIPAVMPLAGRTMRVGPAAVTVGVPSVRPLRPAPTLHARLAVIKGFTEPAAFREAAQRQVAATGAAGRVELVERAGSLRFEQRSEASAGPVRRTIRIRDKEIVGFAVRVVDLSASDSLTLQEQGIGGRQHFGCGVLVPAGQHEGA